MSQAIQDSYSQSLSVANNTRAPVAEIVPLTEAQIAARKEVEKFTEGKGAVAKTAQFALDTLSGYSGMGYRAGRMEEAMLAEKAAISDADFIKAATASAARKAATTVAVATTAVVAPSVLPVAFAGAVAARMVANNETAMAAIKGTAEAAKDYVAGAVNSLRSPQRDALVDTLPKGADGELTAQSQQVLKMVDQRMADAQVKTPDIPPEITR